MPSASLCGEKAASTAARPERIDYIFLIPPRNDFPCRVQLDRADRDHDGIGTRLFADRPNPFAPSCGPLPAAICWPSDHVGVELDLNCR